MYEIQINGEVAYTTASVDTSTFLGEPAIKMEAGKSGSMTFKIYPGHPMYDKITRFKSYVRFYQDGELLYRGRVLSVETNIWKERTVTCEGCLSYLNDQVVREISKTKMTGEAFFRQCIDTYNEQVGEDPERRLTVGTVNVKGYDESMDIEQTSIETVLDTIDDILIDPLGGYLRIRYEGEDQVIDYLKNYGENQEKKVEFGINITDITCKEEGDELYTVFIPTASSSSSKGKNITVASVNNGSDEIILEEAYEKYGRIVKVEDFNADSPAKLLEVAQDYLSRNHVDDPATYEVKAIDMHLIDGTIEQIHVGDKVKIISYPHGYDTEKSCTAIEYNLQNPENSTYTFGDLIEGPTGTSTLTSSGGGSSGGGGSFMSSQTDNIHKYMTLVEKDAVSLAIGLNEQSGEIEQTAKALDSLSMYTRETIKLYTGNLVDIEAPEVDFETNMLKIQRVIEDNQHKVDFSVGVIDSLDNTLADILIKNGDFTEEEMEQLINEHKTGFESDALTATLIDTTITSIHSDITNINSKTLNINSKVVNIESELVTIDGRLEAAEADIARISTDFLSADKLAAMDAIVKTLTVVGGDINVSAGGTVKATTLRGSYIYLNGAQLKKGQVLDYDGIYRDVITWST